MKNKDNNKKDKVNSNVNENENKSEKQDSNKNLSENIKENKEDNLKKEIDILKDKLIRANADFLNYKNRVEKERLEWDEYARIAVLKDILPIVDDFERALQSIESNVDKKELSWLEGFEIIYKNLKKTLEKLEVKEIDCNKEFNPEYHEALMETESDKHKKGEIVHVLNKGYTYGKKVIRHAKVSVAK